jgi:1,4-dihydroxy-2-naphthoate polyprenyltransferase
MIDAESDGPRARGVGVFLRLTRLQFIPLIIVPAILGTTLAYRFDHVFNPLYLGLTLCGVTLLHLGANAIDDCYDYENGVDEIANSIFPKDFGGWKPLPRGLITLRKAKIVSYALFAGSLVFAAFFWLVVGVWSLILGAMGILLAIVYTAPPLKLDYRGYALGEMSILLAFGPIPVLGSFYVQTGMLSLLPILVSIPVGLLTVTILIDHDLIFYEVYSTAKKFSLATVLGRAKSLRASLSMTLFSYLFVLILVAFRVLPVWSFLAPVGSALIMLRKAGTFRKPGATPPEYVPFTVNGMLANWCFSLLLAITALL